MNNKFSLGGRDLTGSDVIWTRAVTSLGNEPSKVKGWLGIGRPFMICSFSCSEVDPHPGNMDDPLHFEDYSLLLTIAGSLLVVYILQVLVTNLRLPAGPWGLPFVGYQPFVGDDPLEDYNKFAKKYGEVFSVKIGSNVNVILSSYEMNREVFVKNSDNFTGIVQEFNVMNYLLQGATSMFQDEGDTWKEQRRFFTSCLRNFGVGKLQTEKNIQNEAESVLHFLRDSDGKPLDFVNSFLLRLMTFNVASSVTFGRRFEYDDEKLLQHIRVTDEYMNMFFGVSVIIDRFPILRFFPHSWTGLDKLEKHKNLAFSLLDNIIREHEEDFDANNIRDITDLYLKKQAELKASGGNPEKTMFSRDCILYNLAFLVMAGTEDTSVAMSWFLKMAAKYPEVQKKMQEEMDRVVGRQRLPSWTDKSQLPYVEGFLHEAMRFASFLPLSSPHTNYEAVTINGFHFPKRTLIQSNYRFINHDPTVWEEPDQFRPERFIGYDGKINSKLRDRVLSFGSGNRSCPGESLARMELFIFITAIIQSFTLRPPPDEDFNFDCTPGAQRRLFKCVLCAEPRD